MEKTAFSFELLDKYPPDIVIGKTLKQIEEATNGYVIGNIAKYDGPIDSYLKTVGLATTLGSLMKTEEVTVNIQDELGEREAGQNKFEVFLTVKELEHYKYRMMFVGYSVISYPATIIMDEELAVAYHGKRSNRFLVGSMKELEGMMDAVINSEKMIKLIQNLINESLRQENKEQMLSQIG